MRLLHVTHQYRPAIGGAERYITDLSEELARRGHQVDVFTSRSQDYLTWHNALPYFEQLDGVNIYRFNSLPRNGLAWRALEYGFRHYWQTRHRFYEPFIFYGSGPVCLGMLDAILRDAHKYDLIHISQLHYSHSFTAYLAACQRHLPIVITPLLHAEQRETYDIGYLQTILKGSQTILTLTTAEKQYLVKLGYDNEIIVSGSGLQLRDFPPLDKQTCRAQFNLPANGFVMLFLGRKTVYKGLDKCLEAFVTLRQQRNDIYFLAVGPETEFSTQLWQRYQGLEGLIVRGTASNEERLAALAACDVLAMPSTGESFGIVYLEAWAYHKAVIGANINAVASLIRDDVDGLLVEPHSITYSTRGLLAHQLNYLADHPEIAQRMGQHGRAKLEQRYTVEHIADIVEGTYARTIRRKNSFK